jgi:hypothetical protein
VFVHFYFFAPGVARDFCILKVSNSAYIRDKMVARYVGTDGEIMASSQSHQCIVSHNDLKNEAGICYMYM